MTDKSADKLINAAWGIAWLLIFFSMDFSGSFSPDDTDAGWTKRSGVALIIDHGTGCQYLKPKNGNIHPRLNSEGQHICEGGRNQ